MGFSWALLQQYAGHVSAGHETNTGGCKDIQESRRVIKTFIFEVAGEVINKARIEK